MLNPVEMPIVREIPERDMIYAAISGGLVCLGGFPLWLVGGSEFYGDIDFYCPSDLYYVVWCDYFKRAGYTPGIPTPNSRTFVRNGMTIQLVTPPWSKWQDMIHNTDLTATAVALTLESGEFVAYALYPDDIKLRRCRILHVHSWTPYRVEVYHGKGYSFYE